MSSGSRAGLEATVDLSCALHSYVVSMLLQRKFASVLILHDRGRFSSARTHGPGIVVEESCPNSVLVGGRSCHDGCESFAAGVVVTVFSSIVELSRLQTAVSQDEKDRKFVVI